MKIRGRGGGCLQNTVGLTFRRLKSKHLGSHFLHPLEAVTFWIASQVGKISNGAILHMGDSVHTPFVWREWFPPGLLACLSPSLGDSRDKEAPNCTICGSPAHVTASWLTTHVTLHFFPFNSMAIYTRSPVAVFSPSSFTPHAPPKHQFSSTLDNSSKLQHICLSVENLGLSNLVTTTPGPSMRQRTYVHTPQYN